MLSVATWFRDHTPARVLPMNFPPASTMNTVFLDTVGLLAQWDSTDQ
jgi:hypothetical protein